jgi:hypothetical protein
MVLYGPLDPLMVEQANNFGLACANGDLALGGSGLLNQ